MDNRRISSTNLLNNLHHINNLNILSWNINDSTDGILGKKPSDQEFTNFLSTCDIFCLQETKGNVKIPGYRCYNSLRTDSRSGGICIGIRHELNNYVKIHNTAPYTPDIQAIELPRNLTGLERNLVIINVYDSPDNSSYKLKKSKAGDFKETITILNEFCKSIPANNHVMILGDFNARTGDSNSLTDDSNSLLQKLSDGSYSKSSHAIVNKRCSKDHVLNERGKKLLDLATEWNLHILNGSTIGDILGTGLVCVIMVKVWWIIS